MASRSILIVAWAGLLAAPVAAQPPDDLGPEDATIIYGVLPTVCTVETESSTVTVQLTSGQQDVTNVLYTCNSINGFARRIFSANSGALMRNGQAIPYLISQTGSGDLAFAPVNLSTELSDDVAPFAELTIGSSGRLRLEIPSIPPGLLAGQYVDTVTIEITPN